MLNAPSDEPAFQFQWLCVLGDFNRRRGKSGFLHFALIQCLRLRFLLLPCSVSHLSCVVCSSKFRRSSCRMSNNRFSTIRTYTTEKHINKEKPAPETIENRLAHYSSSSVGINICRKHDMEVFIFDRKDPMFG